MRKIAICFFSLCAMMVVACDDSSSSSDCTKNADCKGDAPVCNTTTGQCEAEVPEDNKCKSNGDCTSADAPVCNTTTGQCEAAVPADNKCKSNGDCTSADAPVCNTNTGKCEAYPNCSIESSSPCVTACSEAKDAYFAWINGTLLNTKCKDNSCSISAPKVGVEPDTCEGYNNPPESCNPETSASLCSPDGASAWYCDASTNTYFDVQCDASEHCVQCQNKAGCFPIANCTKDSTDACNQVCNESGDGYYTWDVNMDSVVFHVCSQNDCMNKCGIAECSNGTGYQAGDVCDGTLKYCTKDGAFALTCENGYVVQKSCSNNDCIYDAENNEITSCTAE